MDELRITSPRHPIFMGSSQQQNIVHPMNLTLKLLPHIRPPLCPRTRRVAGTIVRSRENMNVFL